jgi:hypothetical protein
MKTINWKKKYLKKLIIKLKQFKAYKIIVLGICDCLI